MGIFGIWGAFGLFDSSECEFCSGLFFDFVLRSSSVLQLPVFDFGTFEKERTVLFVAGYNTFSRHVAHSAFAAIKYEREVGNAPYVFEHNGDGSFDVCEFLFEFFVHGDAFFK